MTSLRPFLEATTHVDPADTRTEDARRRQRSAIPYVVTAAVLLLLAGTFALHRQAGAQERAHASMARMSEQARVSGRQLLIFFTSDTDCAACTRLEQETLSDEALRGMIDRRFQVWRVDRGMPEFSALARDLGIESVPTLVATTVTGTVITDASGQRIQHAGFISADGLRMLLARPVATRRPRENGGEVLSRRASTP
ncbi:MAG: thioredoxin family protein [Phycisphaeraceae bacterium]|nr:thioredoxin family protein [Phycisphaeraceae bacterium]